MQLYRHYTDLPPEARGAVVTLGNFDGVHRGHQAVIARAADLARSEGRTLAVLTFEPHTRSFFRPEDPPFRLTPLRAKLHALESLGADQVLVLHFDHAFSRLSPSDFVGRVLVGGLGIAHAVAGSDFRYGHKHAGTMETLAAAGKEKGFGVTAVSAVAAPGGVVFSATAIRQLLQAGEMRRAAEFLGRPWEIDGRVVPGDRRGRELGFPTANMHLGDYLRPAFGVYAVRAQIDRSGGGWMEGVASLGIRPMWRVDEPLLEVHLFDFSGDLYGHTLRVQLIERLRPEAKFDTIDALVAQVGRDMDTAREALVSTGS